MAAKRLDKLRRRAVPIFEGMHRYSRCTVKLKLLNKPITGVNSLRTSLCSACWLLSADPDGRYQLGCCGHADPRHHLPPSDFPPGATRRPIPEVSCCPLRRHHPVTRRVWVDNVRQTSHQSLGAAQRRAAQPRRRFGSPRNFKPVEEVVNVILYRRDAK
jgi:hypothetical protein